MNVSYSKTALTVVLVLAGAFVWKIKSTKMPSVSREVEVGTPSVVSKRQPAAGVLKGASQGSALGDKEELLALLRRTQECYQREDCEFPHTDPKSYEIAVGQKLKELLNRYRDQYGRDLKNKIETETLAREFMRSEDHFVQEVSLSLFSDLPPSAENLEVITSTLHETVDPLLVEQAMNEMKRYVGTTQEAQVHLFLQGLLEQGAVFSSEQAVQGIFSFINARSYSGYEKVARSLPENSRVGKDLRALLEEYRRMRIGG